MGACPSDYLVIRAARYLGVPPWELEERGIEWYHKALAYESAENQAARDRLISHPHG